MESPTYMVPASPARRICVAEIHGMSEDASSTSAASSVLEKVEKINITTNHILEIEDSVMETNVDGEATAVEDFHHRVVINGEEYTNVLQILQRPDELPEYSRCLYPLDNLFATFDNDDREIRQTFGTRLAASMKKKAKTAQKAMSCPPRFWKILCFLLSVAIVLLMIFTRRSVHNSYYLYH